MSRFVLVHGAWHGAWCWEKVTPLLTARGHEAYAIDLPGHGQDPKPPGSVSWNDYLARMGEVLAAQPEPAVLVGHSLGGAVITGAADRWPERIRALVYVCALLPDGPSFMSEFQPTASLSAATRPSSDGTQVLIDRAAVRAAFYQDCSDEDATRAAARLGPQPAGVMAMGFELAPERFGRIARHYVECLEDRAIDIAAQRAMHEKMPCTVHTLPASHSPFYSMPERLVEVLLQTAG